MASETPDAIIAAIHAFADASGLTFHSQEGLGSSDTPEAALELIKQNLETIHLMGADLQKVHTIQHMLADIGEDLVSDPEKAAAFARSDLPALARKINEAVDHAEATGQTVTARIVSRDDPRLNRVNVEGEGETGDDGPAPSIGFAPWKRKPTHGGNNSRN